MNLFQANKAYHTGAISKPRYIDEMYELHAILFQYGEYIQHTDIACIEIRDGLVVMTSRSAGIKIVCDPMDKRIAPIEILNFGAYEPVDLDMILRLFDANSNFFDIGANVGWYSLNIAKHFPDARVFAFEPIPVTFNSLKRNIDINQPSNINLHNFGFSNREETLKFYYYPEGSSNASAANLSEGETVREVLCQVRKLDDFVRNAEVSVDFIKCDVEGAELFVYQGGIECIKRDKPVIFTEMLRKWSAQFNYHPNDIIELLVQVGYRCFVAKQKTLSEFFAMDEHTLETNFFFLHADKHAAQIESVIS
jgi:FkbM family methyltransferase